MTRILPLLFLLFSQTAFACRIRLEQPHTSYQELLRWSDTIALAVVESGSPIRDDSTRYRFKTLKIISGAPPEFFEIDAWWPMGRPLPESQTTSFDNHTDPEFWVHGGRSGEGMSCTIQPVFEVGARYLVFLDKPWHESGFEKIERDDDLWLRVVELFVTSGR